jgi:signal transduction histidine kinase
MASTTLETLFMLIVAVSAVAGAIALRDVRIKARALLESAREAEQSAKHAQRELQSAHEKFAAFMVNFPYPAFIQDEGGAFVFVNQAALDSGGWREATPSVDGSTRTLPETITVTGSDCHYFSIRFPLTIEGREWLGGIAIDISERVRAERALREYEAELERAVRRRDEFLAVLAHELRNPLAPIRNSVQILQRVPADAERVRRATDTIERQTSLMVRLIDDLLDVARVSQGLVELALAPLAVGTIVTGAIEVAQANAPATGHSIVVEHQNPGATVVVDGLRAEQIVVNLLSNAMKYSAPRTRIVVRSRVESGYAKIAVIDEGRGIPKESLPDLFTMFARPRLVEGHRIGGLGVGLAVAKQLSEQLGGYLDVASEGPGTGATFTVSFPLARAAADFVG